MLQPLISILLILAVFGMLFQKIAMLFHINLILQNIFLTKILYLYLMDNIYNFIDENAMLEFNLVIYNIMYLFLIK